MRITARHALVVLALECQLVWTLPAESNPHRDYAQSTTVTTYGIVATSQVLASEAGAATLARGGSAVDAVIAANAALGVIEPMMNGIGGDLFAIVYDAKSKTYTGINASGWAPKGSSIAYLKAHGATGAMPSSGPQSVTVPGAVAGWAALHSRFGKLPWKDDLQPAIFLASKGFPLQEMNAQAWRIFAPAFAEVPGFQPIFLPHGRAPATGELFQNADLADSLQVLADKGRDGFYRGRIANAIVHFLNAQGNPMSAEDLSEFQPEWVEPIATTYRDWTIRELPPNGQGVAALEMLNIMERFPLPQYGHNSTQALHIEIEAKKLAYADLARYVADSRFAKVPVRQMISKDFAASRAREIAKQAACHVLPAELVTEADRLGSSSRDTTYLTAVDREGNVASLIQSNAAAFGSGLTAPGTGFVLQNRGSAFSLDAGHPNAFAPRKRPFHTIIPGMMSKDDTIIGFGIMGGLNQPQAHAQFVSNVVDFRMDLQAALDAARFTKPTFDGCDIMMEARIPKPVRDELTSRGHKIETLDGYTQQMGRGNAVMVDGKGVKQGASDPRADGLAIPEVLPFWSQLSGRK